jgi:hypothetical protein
MAFTLNDVTVGAMPGLASLTLHETAKGQNRVVHVVVPIAKQPRQTLATKKKQARTLAKAALEAAAKAL